MNIRMAEYERVARIRRRVGGLAVLAVLAGIGAWLTAPFGIVIVARGDASGWLLIAVGAVLAAACVVAVVAAVQTGRRVARQSLPGKANPGYGEPQPSQDPRPGTAWAGSMLGSR